MASLTHVCMWNENGWKHITAEDAARLHPGGKVTAGSGLFMCELCGQYVALTDGKGCIFSEPAKLLNFLTTDGSKDTGF